MATISSRRRRLECHLALRGVRSLPLGQLRHISRRNWIGDLACFADQLNLDLDLKLSAGALAAVIAQAAEKYWPCNGQPRLPAAEPLPAAKPAVRRRADGTVTQRRPAPAAPRPISADFLVRVQPAGMELLAA
jgi:hypothetical protein